MSNHKSTLITSLKRHWRGQAKGARGLACVGTSDLSLSAFLLCTTLRTVHKSYERVRKKESLAECLGFMCGTCSQGNVEGGGRMEVEVLVVEVLRV